MPVRVAGRQLVGRGRAINTPANKKFVADFQAWLKTTKTPGIVKDGRVTCSPMVLSYVGVYLWKAAVEKAGSFDVDKVRAAYKSGLSEAFAPLGRSGS